uniref:Uncharacterized protein n=1 Tax=Arundo donax TaxID=35708 RepID=A0A0A9HA74_ARUDO
MLFDKASQQVGEQEDSKANGRESKRKHRQWDYARSHKS